MLDAGQQCDFWAGAEVLFLALNWKADETMRELSSRINCFG